jgi:hypothetical protein
MSTSKICLVLALSLLLAAAGQVTIGLAGQDNPGKQAKLLSTDTLRIMDKGVDCIYVGEQPLYVLPEITKITNTYGTTISLDRLRTPCLAEVTYARWMKGVNKLPVVVELKVKRVYRNATATSSREL